MKNFSKLFLASLLAGSLIMTGCGESNPTSSNNAPGTNPAEDGNTKAAFRIWGNIIDNSDVKISLTNKGTDQSFSKTESSSYAFENLQSGVYEIKAEKAGYETFSTCQEFSASSQINIELEKIAISGETKVSLNFQGTLSDTIGKPIPFATITVTGGKDDIIANTAFDNANYTLLGLSSGTYKVTFSKNSFNTETRELKINDEFISFNGSRIEKADFGSTTSFTDAAGNSHKGYKLAPVVMSPIVIETGSIAGVICYNGAAISKGTKVDLYRRAEDSEYSVPSLIVTVTAGDNGYFYAKNLQAGYYTAALNGSSVDDTQKDSQGTPIYKIKGTVYFQNMQVVNNFMTPVPSAEQ